MPGPLCRSANALFFGIIHYYIGFVSKSGEKSATFPFQSSSGNTRTCTKDIGALCTQPHKPQPPEFLQIAPSLPQSGLVRSLPPTLFQEQSQLQAFPFFEADFPLRLPVLAIALFLVNGKGFPAWLVRAHFCMVSHRSPDWQGFSMVGNGCGWVWVCALLRTLRLSQEDLSNACRLRPTSKDGASGIPASFLGYLSVQLLPVEYLNSQIPSFNAGPTAWVVTILLEPPPGPPSLPDPYHGASAPCLGIAGTAE